MDAEDTKRCWQNQTIVNYALKNCQETIKESQASPEPAALIAFMNNL